MGWPQIVSGALLVAVLAGAAGAFAWGQVRALRRLATTPDLPDDERRQQRGQAWRRLIGAGLLLVLAIMLVWILLFLENPAQLLADQSDATPGRVEWTDAQRDFIRYYSVFWIVFLLILFLLVMLVGYEVWSLRRYALRERRKIQADRRAMIERQANRLRQERNGQG
jgi:hypothetical protein